MLFGAHGSTAGVMMARFSNPKATALRIMVPRLPESEGLTRIICGAAESSGRGVF